MTHVLVRNPKTGEELAVLEKYGPEYEADGWELIGKVRKGLAPHHATASPKGRVVEHKERRAAHEADAAVERRRRMPADQVIAEIETRMFRAFRALVPGLTLTAEQVAEHFPHAHHAKGE